MFRININTGLIERSGFGKEIKYLEEHGYKFIVKKSNYKIDINVPSDVRYIKKFATSGNVIYDWPP